MVLLESISFALLRCRPTRSSHQAAIFGEGNIHISESPSSPVDLLLSASELKASASGTDWNFGTADGLGAPCLDRPACHGDRRTVGGFWAASF